jgi:hypothetical protein
MAQSNLASLYTMAKGVPQSYADVVNRYRKAEFAIHYKSRLSASLTPSQTAEGQAPLRHVEGRRPAAR